MFMGGRHSAAGDTGGSSYQRVHRPDIQSISAGIIEEGPPDSKQIRVKMKWGGAGSIFWFVVIVAAYDLCYGSSPRLVGGRNWRGMLGTCFDVEAVD